MYNLHEEFAKQKELDNLNARLRRLLRSKQTSIKNYDRDATKIQSEIDRLKIAD